MVRRSGLGRGLDALLPAAAPEDVDRRDMGRAPAGSAADAPRGSDAGQRPPTPAPAPVSEGQVPDARVTDDGEPAVPTPAFEHPSTERLGVLREVPIDLVRPNRHQPRTSFDDEALDALAASIAELGVLQPVLVREVPGSEDLELIAGERRWRASRRAGLTMIPALVRTIDDTRSLQEALVENVQREDLNAIEEALAYRQLVEEFGSTQDEVAKAVGRSRSAVANTLRLLGLPETVQELVAAGSLSAGHARALLGLDDAQAIESLATRIVESELTVREVEELVRRAREPAPQAPPPAPAPVRPAALLEVEERLADIFDTRVRVDVGPKSGKLVVTFADMDDLDRIFSLMIGSHPSVEDDLD